MSCGSSAETKIGRETLGDVTDGGGEANVATASIALGGEFGPNPLHDWFANHKGRLINKWHHYFDIYHRHFGAVRAAATSQRKVVMYEIGVWHGGSLEMWLDYFGRDRCEIYAFDIDVKCAELRALDPHIHVTIGDQGDPDFLRRITETLPRPDIVLDDGGHLMAPQIMTMHALFPHLKPSGVYMCEDTHTSYMWVYGGKAGRPSTYIEAVKRLADSMHSFHADAIVADYYSKWCDALHMYDSVVVLDKRATAKVKPTSDIRGTRTIPGGEYLPAVSRALHAVLTTDAVESRAEKRDPAPAKVASVSVQILRATYGDAYVRKDVRQMTQQAMKVAFAHGRVFDLAAPEHAPTSLYGDPCPGRVKLLQLEVRCVVNREYATTQLLSVAEASHAWVWVSATGSDADVDADATQVPHRHVRLLMDDDTRITVEDVVIETASAESIRRPPLASPPTTLDAVHDASWDVSHHPFATDAGAHEAGADREQRPRSASAVATPCRGAELNVVYHICTIGNWRTIVADQLQLIRASGLYTACRVIFVSIVGPHALEWQPPPEMLRKTHVLHRATDPTRYERSAIDILQSEPRDDSRSCWLYLHTKGVRHGATNRNVELWRNCLEYYAVENFAACVRTLLSGYDTCGPFWQPTYGVALPGQHYSGNVWWATGAHLVRLRALHTSASYYSPEMWIGYAQPRAWSLHDVPPGLNLYTTPYARDEYEGKISLPPDAIAPLDVGEIARAAKTPPPPPTLTPPPQTAPLLPQSAPAAPIDVPLRRQIEAQADDPTRRIRWIEGVMRVLADPLPESYSHDTGRREHPTTGVVVRSASYGDSTRRLDVTDRVRVANAGADTGLALAFTNSINAPRRLLADLPDPAPGVAKYLEVDVAYEVAADRATVVSAYGPQALADAYGDEQKPDVSAHTRDSGAETAAASGNGAESGGSAGSGAGNSRVPVWLRHMLRVDEYGGAWRTPKAAVPRATTSLVVAHGMANQIYGVASGCLIAHHTRRALTFPFRVVARQTATDIDNPYVLPRPDIDRAFSHLFDAHEFAARPICMLHRCDATGSDGGGGMLRECDGHRSDGTELLGVSTPGRKADGATPQQTGAPVELKEASGARPSLEKRRRFERALLHGDTKLDVPPGWTRSAELDSAYALSSQHVLTFNPFFAAIPSNNADYNRMLDVILSLRPAPRLQRLVDTLLGVVRQHALRHTASERFVVVHCRQEADWPRELAALPKSLATDTHAHLSAAGYSGDLAVYLMGGTNDDAFWHLLQSERHSTDSGLNLLWMRKEMWAHSHPELTAIGFEEGALIDRETALAAVYFIPFPGSTLSAIAVIEREAMRRSSAPTMRDCPAFWLLDPHGNSLYSYTGTHPRSTGAALTLETCGAENKLSSPSSSRLVPPPVAQRLQIVAVTFGGASVSVRDFCAHVAVFSGAHSLYVATDVDVTARLGDPAPLRPKVLLVDYVWRGVPLRRQASERNGRLCEPLLIGDVDELCAALPQLGFASRLDAHVSTQFASVYGSDRDASDETRIVSRGLEVGGPSDGFVADLYPLCAQLDNIVFSPETVWHSTATAPATAPPSSSSSSSSPPLFSAAPSSLPTSSVYRVAERQVGRQYIGEASDTKLPTGAYDYVLASHCLEHAANALKTLREWQRLVKPGGWIVLVLPWRHATFDHRRPYTTIEHLRDDAANNVDESDLTHLDEILRLHDMARDPPAVDANHMRLRSLKNAENRCLHHHVFSQRLLFEIAVELGYRVVEMDVIRQLDMVCIYQTAVPPSTPSHVGREKFLV